MQVDGFGRCSDVGGFWMWCDELLSKEFFTKGRPVEFVALTGHMDCLMGKFHFGRLEVAGYHFYTKLLIFLRELFFGPGSVSVGGHGEAQRNLLLVREFLADQNFLLTVVTEEFDVLSRRVRGKLLTH